MKKTVSLVIMFCFALTLNAQELFPVADLASSVPKGVLGVRLFDEGYREANLFRNLAGIKLLYGVTPKLSVYVAGTASDYHEKTLPFDFISHDHTGGQTVARTTTPREGNAYPFVFNSLDVFMKYRFVTTDREHMHFRMAGYGEVSYVAVPSHEAEPDLLVHTSGYAAGLISTYLKGHFAASVTAGFIIPTGYKGNATDKYGGIYPTTIQYGNAVNYSLSLGYLLYPQNYKGYQQANWNVYMEFIGKSYGSASISQRDGPASNALSIPVSTNTPILTSGNYIDIDPGIQCILNSTYRVDVSMAFPLVNRSYSHLYPSFQAGVQRYFFFNRRESKKNDKL